MRSGNLMFYAIVKPELRYISVPNQSSYCSNGASESLVTIIRRGAVSSFSLTLLRKNIFYPRHFQATTRYRAMYILNDIY